MSRGLRLGFTVLYVTVAIVAVAGGAIAGHLLAGVAMAAFVFVQIAALPKDDGRTRTVTVPYIVVALMFVAAAVTDEPVFGAMAAFCLIKAFAGRVLEKTP